MSSLLFCPNNGVVKAIARIVDRNTFFIFMINPF
jgi:hypothetical protein